MWKRIENQTGVVIHNWNGKVQFGLPLFIGDFVEIFEENNCWYRGRCHRNFNIIGLFPKSFIHLKLKTLNNSERFLNECNEILAEWHTIWKKSFVERDYKKFQWLQKIMNNLIRNCRNLYNQSLKPEELLQLQTIVFSTIDWGNRNLGLDLIPRLGPFSVDIKNAGIVFLQQAHILTTENSKVSLVQIQNKKAETNIKNYHLHFCLHKFQQKFYEKLQFYFYLYDGQKKCAITERFLIPVHLENQAKYDEATNTTIFTDLALSDFNINLCMVVVAIRIGKIRVADTIKNKDNYDYRRPHSIGICRLSKIIKNEMFIKFQQFESVCSIKLYTCDDKYFYQLHDFIIKNDITKFQPINSDEKINDIIFSLKLLKGNLNQIRMQLPSSLLLQNTIITRKIGFGEIFVPSDIRNDLFLTLENGLFEMGTKTAGKNIEVTVVPLTSSGKIIPNCLWSASNVLIEDITFRSIITYHNNTPYFNEQLRIDIPPEIIHDTHILLEFRHCSTRDKNKPKIYGFSFIRLTRTNGEIISNKSYELYVYKSCDAQNYLAANYLKLPYYQFDDRATQHSSTIFRKSLKEMFRIKIELYSMKLTQNSDLVSLLKWKKNPEILYNSLNGLLQIENEELIKYFPDILEILFEIFATKYGRTEHSGLVFHILMNIFSLLKIEKFQNYKIILDNYIVEKFSSNAVHTVLLQSLHACTICLPTTDNKEPIRKCFESMEYIFKFIIKSKKLYYLNVTEKRQSDSFRQYILPVFNSFQKILKMDSDLKILIIQRHLLQTIGTIFQQLHDSLPASELAVIAKNLYNIIPKNACRGLIQAKLQSFKDIVTGDLFIDHESRLILLVCICTHLRYHIIREDDRKICVDVIAEILLQLNKIQKENKSVNALIPEYKIICKNLFSKIIQILNSKIDLKYFSSLVSVLLGILQELNVISYSPLWDEFNTIDELKDFLLQCLTVIKKLTVNWNVFPHDWFVMKFIANNIIQTTLQEFGKLITNQFVKEESFSYELWWTYFTVAVSFITQPFLQLEKYNKTKSSEIIKQHDDMRDLMGFEILDIWTKLTNHKLDFVPSMVGPFLEITLIPKISLRKAILPVFYDMMECEQSSIGSIRYVQNELIDKLDILINQNKGDKEYKDLFCSVLLEKINAENPTWKDASAGFISSVTELLQMLLDYRSVLEGSENREKRMTCIVNLVNFYRNDIRGKEKYIRYIYKLHDLHMEVQNFIEAGLTLKLYFDKLNWNVESVVCSFKEYLNGKPEWECKQILCLEIINLLKKGKCWEKAIPLCKELADFYEKHRFDYTEVGKILEIEQKCFENILTEVRHAPEYFQVNFYGLGFPSFVQNKRFIYRGYELERISDFIERIQNEFPQAKILTKNTTPENAIILSSEQFLQITTVRPIVDTEYFKKAMIPVSDRITKFYMYNDVKRFQNDRPMQKGIVDQNNEFKTLWIVRTTFEIDQSLPGILRWFEVTESIVEDISPIEFACETMEYVNRELLDLTAEYQENKIKSLNPFTMRLQGVIDANVQGGISKYQEAFFTKNFLKEFENAPLVQKLKSLIFLQSQILNTALELHGKLACIEVMPLHKLLLIRYGDLKQKIDTIKRFRKNCESIVNSPLPPLPIKKNRSGSLDKILEPTQLAKTSVSRVKEEEYEFLEPFRNVQNNSFNKNTEIKTMNSIYKEAEQTNINNDMNQNKIGRIQQIDVTRRTIKPTYEFQYQNHEIIHKNNKQSTNNCKSINPIVDPLYANEESVDQKIITKRSIHKNPISECEYMNIPKSGKSISIHTIKKNPPPVPPRVERCLSVENQLVLLKSVECEVNNSDFFESISDNVTFF